MNQELKILIVSEHASAEFGGEAALPLHYFRVLRSKGESVWLVVHARTRPELTRLFPDEQRIHYVEDTVFHKLMWRLSRPLPARLVNATFGYVMRISTQVAQRRMARRLVASEGINVVHQPMPVSPREPSLMYGLGVPVVMGPMNGAIDFPPAFARYQSRMVSAVVATGRALSGMLNRLMPGKLNCAVLAVANERTRLALPRGARGRVVELVENGVDLNLWSGREVSDEPESSQVPRFVYMGRLVDWKAVDLLLEAFHAAKSRSPMSLTIVGDGPERQTLELLCVDLGELAAVEGEPGKVFFAGWKSQVECAAILNRSSALVLPSLMECGGAVVLEAMAAGRPVIATHWGGPADYLDPSCGLLIRPDSRQSFVSGLAEALATLAQSRERRIEMGRAGRRKAVQFFDWDRKVERMTDIYRGALVPCGGG